MLGKAATDATVSSAQRFYEASLLGMIASGYFAVLGSGELDIATAASVLIALVLRALKLFGFVRFEFPSRWVDMAALSYLLIYPIDLLLVSRSFLTATVHMIFFVAVVKILAAKTARDFGYLKLIAGMELLAAALLSNHLSFFVFLTTFVLCGIATFAGGEILRSMRSGRIVAQARPRLLQSRLLLVSGSLFCGILLMTAGLFFVLPRTARAAFQRFVPQRYHVPGFASQISLGQIGALKQNSAPVMHIRSYDQRPLIALRWRGSALSTFDGERWFNPPAREERLTVQDGKLVLPTVRRTRPARSIGYEVQLSEIAPDTLFFAGTPETISIQARNLFRANSGAIRAPRFGLAGLRYGAYSRIENEAAAPIEAVAGLSSDEEKTLLQLPSLDPRVEELARSWTSRSRDSIQTARAIEEHFHRDFRYSLDGLNQPVSDPVAHFLFETKQGHCEYFASAMAVMLRTLGIPSRVATGFLGGEFNPLSGWQVIRASDAHSWVEAWIPGQGWMTFDPTPPDSSIPQSSLWSRAALVIDAADQFWRDWVLSYDFDHQLLLASRMQNASRVWRTETTWTDLGVQFEKTWREQKGFVIVLVSIAGIGVVAILAAPSIRTAWAKRARLRRAREGHARPSDATVLYERMLTLLHERGYQKPSWVTPQEFARVLPDSELSLLVGDMTDAYNQVRFGGQADCAPRMARVLQRIEALGQSQ